MKIENAKIVSTHLGNEDHGIFTFILNLEGESWGQSFGGYALDDTDGDRRHATEFGLAVIIAIINALETSTWERLPGTHVRIQRDDYNQIVKIGHIYKEKWVDVKEIAANYY